MKSKVRSVLALFMVVSILSGTLPITSFAESAFDTVADVAEEDERRDVTAEEPGLTGVPWYWRPDGVESEGQGSMTIEDYDGSQRDQIVDFIVEKYPLWDGLVSAKLTIKEEDMGDITGLGPDATQDEIYEWWGREAEQIVYDAREALSAERSFAYWRYIYAAGHRFTTSPINFAWDGEGGYTITIKTGGNPWFHNYQKEVELRKFVQNLYSPGGELYPYRAENDLYSDYEKYTAVWNWIKNNISYGGTHSAWQGIVQGGTFCDGYSAGNALLCAYAGVESIPVIGYIPAGKHAWSWIKIGEKYFVSDSTANNVNGQFFLVDQEEKDGYHQLDEYEEPAEIQARYPRYTFTYNEALEDGNKIDSGRIGDNLSWILSEGVLTISGKGDMRDFEDPFLVPWRNSTEYIKKVVIKDGVTSIGANAFYSLQNIKKDDSSTAEIAESVKKIGKHAFYDPNDPVTEFSSRLSLKSSFERQYEGTGIKREDIVHEAYYGTTPASDSDFQYRYSTDKGVNWTNGLPENVGTYVIEVTLKEKNLGGITYHSSKDTISATVTKGDFTVKSIQADTGRIYDGTTKVNIDSVFTDYSHWWNRHLEMGVDYDVTAEYVSPDVGTYTAYMTVTPRNTDRMNNYNLTYPTEPVSTTFRIRPKTLTEEMFDKIPDQAHTGAEVRPLLSIADSEADIMSYDDFTVTYENNVSEGTGYAVVKGQNNYTGEVRLPFKIDASLEAETTLTPINSSGAVSRTFTYPEIMKVDLEHVKNMQGQTVSLHYTEKDGSLSSEPLAEAMVGENGSAEFTVNTHDKKLPSGSHTLVAVPAQKQSADLEIAHVAVTLNKIKLTATPSESCYVVKEYDGTTKALTLEEGGRQYNVKLDLDNVVDGDEVNTTYVCEHASAEIGDHDLLFKNIALAGKDADFYHLTNTTASIGTVKHPFDGTYTIRAEIVRADVTPHIQLGEKIYDGTSDVPITDITWDGLVGDDTLRQTTDYTIEAHFNETNAGKQSVTVTMKLLNTPATSHYRLVYYDPFTIEGTIKPKEITEQMFEKIPKQSYTGEKIEPEVKVAATEKLLTKENYTLTYGENINGTGSVTVTGKKNYTGEVTLTFPISGGEEQSSIDGDSYRGNTQTSDFIYGDIITVRGLASGVNEGTKVYLYNGDTLLGEASTNEKGNYEIDYYTNKKSIPASGETASLRLRLGGKTESEALAVKDIKVSLSPRQVTARLTGDAVKVYDGTTGLPENHSMKILLDDILAVDSSVLTAEGSYRFESASAGTKTVIASDLILVDSTSAGVESFYQLAGDKEITTEVTGGINQAVITSAITAQDKDYDGEKSADVTVTFSGLAGDEQLTLDQDYTVTASFDNKNAGTDKTVRAVITLKDKGAAANYKFDGDTPTKAEVTDQADIRPLALKKEMFVPVEDQPWTGSQITPKISIAKGYDLLTKDDFKVPYGENIRESGTVTITGTNNYTGTVDLTFTIVGDAPLPELSARTYKGSAEETNFTYGDTITVKGAAALSSGASNGKVTLYVNGSQVGKTVKVDSEGTYTLTYNTEDKEFGASGDPVVLELRLSDSVDEKAASVQTKIVLSPKEVTAVLSGDAKKTYDGTADVPDAHSLKLSLEGVLEADKDQVSVSGDYAFTDVNANTSEVIATNVTLSNAAENVDVAGFYRLPEGTEVSAHVAGGISPAVLTADAEAKDRIYDGTADAEAVVTLAGLQNSETLTSGTDYTVTASFENENAAAGKKVTVNVTLSDSPAASNYCFRGSGETEEKTVTCTVQADITPLTLTTEMFIPIADQTYTGSPLTPQVTLAEAYASLLDANDYKAAYGSNTDAGTGLVSIAGQNNAQGSVDLYFRITGLMTTLTAQTEDESGNPTSQFVYGDRIVVTGTFATTDARARSLRAASQAGDGQVALYVGDIQVSEPQNVSMDNRSFTLSVNTGDKEIPAGDTVLKLRYLGSASLAASEIDIPIRLEKRVLTPEAHSDSLITKTYDGTVEVPADQTPRITLAGSVADGDTPTASAPVWSYAAADAAETVDIIGSGLVLDGSWQRWYDLSTDTVTLTGGGRIEKSAQSAQNERVDLPAGTASSSVTKLLSGLVPEDAGGVPVYKVISYTENGLVSASVNEKGELSVVSKEITDVSMTDTVIVEVSGMANYSDFTIEVTVGYADRTPVTITFTPRQTAAVYNGQQIQGYGEITAVYTDENGFAQPYNNLSYIYEGATRSGEVYGPVSAPPSQAGSYTVTASVPETDIMYAGSQSFAFVIEPASLTFKADNIQIEQGAAMPVFTYTVEGLVSGDSLITEPIRTTSAADTSMPGIYTISIAGADAGANYIIAGYVSGTLTITAVSNPEPDPGQPPVLDPDPGQPSVPDSASGIQADPTVQNTVAASESEGKKKAQIPPKTRDNDLVGLHVLVIAGAFIISVLGVLGMQNKRNRRKNKTT